MTVYSMNIIFYLKIKKMDPNDVEHIETDPSPDYDYGSPISYTEIGEPPTLR